MRLREVPPSPPMAGWNQALAARDSPLALSRIASAARTQAPSSGIVGRTVAIQPSKRISQHNRCNPPDPSEHVAQPDSSDVGFIKKHVGNVAIEFPVDMTFEFRFPCSIARLDRNGHAEAALFCPLRDTSPLKIAVPSSGTILRDRVPASHHLFPDHGVSVLKRQVLVHTDNAVFHTLNSEKPSRDNQSVGFGVTCHLFEPKAGDDDLLATTIDMRVDTEQRRTKGIAHGPQLKEVIEGVEAVGIFLGWLTANAHAAIFGPHFFVLTQLQQTIDVGSTKLRIARVEVGGRKGSVSD